MEPHPLAPADGDPGSGSADVRDPGCPCSCRTIDPERLPHGSAQGPLEIASLTLPDGDPVVAYPA